MFKDRLRQLRKTRSGLTQAKMAKYLGIAKTTYASYEQGNRMPDIEIQKELADYFNVSLDYLHGRPNDLEALSMKQIRVASRIIEDFTEYQLSEINTFIEFIKNRPE